MRVLDESNESEAFGLGHEDEGWEDVSDISDVDEDDGGRIAPQGSTSSRQEKCKADAKEFMRRHNKDVSQQPVIDPKRIRKIESLDIAKHIPQNKKNSLRNKIFDHDKKEKLTSKVYLFPENHPSPPKLRRNKM